MTKSEIRSWIKARKSLLSQEEKDTAAKLVFEQLEKCAAFMLAEKVLMYHSLPDELSTHRFLEKWGDKKEIFLPRVNGVNLDILPYNRSKMALGAFHIEEPQGSDFVDIKEIDMIIVPAIAYDHNGNRIGRGKGYYDRLLPFSRATKIGVGYDFQFINEEIPAEEHDATVDMIITNTRCHIINRKN